MYKIYLNTTYDILKNQTYIMIKSRINNSTTVDECTNVRGYRNGYE